MDKQKIVPVLALGVMILALMAGLAVTELISTFRDAETQINQRAQNSIALAKGGGGVAGGKGGGGGGGSGSLPSCLEELSTDPLLVDYATYIASQSELQRFADFCDKDPRVLSWFFIKLREAESTGLPPSVAVPQEYTDFLNSGSLANSIYIGPEASTEIYGAKLANIFFIEVRQKTPWRLADYNDDDLKTVLAYGSSGEVRGSNFFNVFNYSPRIAWDVVQANADLTAAITRADGVRELIKHMRDFHHGGILYDANGNIISDTRYGLPTLNQMATDMTSRQGCWSSVDYLLAVAGALNLPGKEIGDYYAGTGHATAVFEAENYVLAHGDNPYNALLDNTPMALLLDSYSRWKDEVLRYKPGDSRAAYNSKTHEYDMALRYPSQWMMQNYCAQGTEARLWLEDIFNDSWGSYATTAELDDYEVRLLQSTNNCTTFPSDDPESQPQV